MKRIKESGREYVADVEAWPGPNSKGHRVVLTVRQGFVGRAAGKLATRIVCVRRRAGGPWLDENTELEPGDGVVALCESAVREFEAKRGAP